MKYTKIQEMLILKINAIPAIIMVACFSIMPLAHAEVETYEGTGECIISEFETQDIGKQRAKQRAEQRCVEQAGLYVETHSSESKGYLTEDVTTTIAASIIKVTDVKYTKGFTDDGSGIRIIAKITAKIDSNDITKFLKQGTLDNGRLVEQYKELQRERERQDKEISNLRQKLANATSDQEKKELKAAVLSADKRFLSSKLTEEGIKIFTHPDPKYDNLNISWNKAINLFTKAIELDGSNAKAYTWRCLVYQQISGQYAGEYPDSLNADPEKYRYYEDLAASDITQALKVDPNYGYAHVIQGLHYVSTEEQTLAELSKAIDVDPNCWEAYYSRSIFYTEKLHDYNSALNDINRAIELAPHVGDLYYSRGTLLIFHFPPAYNKQGEADRDKSIKLSSIYSYK